MFFFSFFQANQAIIAASSNASETEIEAVDQDLTLSGRKKRKRAPSHPLRLAICGSDDEDVDNLGQTWFR